MDIRFLSTFLEVSNTRHFGKAAENLYLTQAAVSARIKLLEEFFNVKLFTRHRNSIQLTPAGELLIPYAKQLTDTLKEAQHNVIDNKVHYLSVASTSCAQEIYFANALPKLAGQYPDLHVKSDILSSDMLLRHLLEHTIDIGFSTEYFKSDEIEKLAVWQSPLSFYTAQGQRHEAFSEGESGSSANYVHIEYSIAVSESVFKQVKATRHPKLRTPSPSVGVQALSDDGVILLPDAWVSEQALQLQKLEQPEIAPLNVFAYWRKDCELNLLPEITKYCLGLGLTGQ
ncbi:LysR family transcriptional regulator [Alteromonas oceanisediminis]|uniref:LysR family transcriptional regulator n=1 Tax=Alteromonas oceanisediminis TaxID=2836180 RepID=UPI001BDA1666|nr:LysR family transcriptional regulator [Alteromonas oceanisediminis]MBT0586466.1 LysR family transcriptional regulator [Alteromonas oceanisediminis]